MSKHAPHCGLVCIDASVPTEYMVEFDDITSIRWFFWGSGTVDQFVVIDKTWIRLPKIPFTITRNDLDKYLVLL